MEFASFVSSHIAFHKRLPLNDRELALDPLSRHKTMRYTHQTLSRVIGYPIPYFFTVCKEMAHTQPYTVIHFVKKYLLKA